MQQTSTDIRYPLDFKDMKYFITFRARDYKYKNKTDLEKTTVEKVPLCNISLSFPGSFQENLQQNWGEGEIFSSATPVKKGIEMLKNKLGDALFNRTISRQGVTINPSEEILYQGPGFRTFDFMIDLVAKSKEELSVVKKIESLFRVLQAPRLAKDATYIAFPAIWEIEIKGFESEEDSQLFTMGFKDKYFALTSVSLNYGPDGNYYPIKGDGHPIKTSINLSFKETAPLYRKEMNGEPEIRGLIGSIEGFFVE